MSATPSHPPAAATDGATATNISPPTETAAQQSLPQIAPSAPTATMYCPTATCSVRLAFPANAPLIRCPSCSQCHDPKAPQQTKCFNCNALLAYPPTSQLIECPLCRHQMNPHANPPVSPAQQQQILKPVPKKRKDPNAPKSVANAYMNFCKARRPKLKEEFPDLPFGKLGQKLGEIWRSLPPEQKKPYEDLAASDRERYRRSMFYFQQGIKVNPDGSLVPPPPSPDGVPRPIVHYEDRGEDIKEQQMKEMEMKISADALATAQAQQQTLQQVQQIIQQHQLNQQLQQQIMLQQQQQAQAAAQAAAQQAAQQAAAQQAAAQLQQQQQQQQQTSFIAPPQQMAPQSTSPDTKKRKADGPHSPGKDKKAKTDGPPLGVPHSVPPNVPTNALIHNVVARLNSVVPNQPPASAP